MPDGVNYWQQAMRRRMSRRGILRAGAGAGLGLAGLSLLGCPQQQQKTEVVPAEKQAKYGGVFRLRTAGDPPNLDPHMNYSAYTTSVLGRVYSRLVRFKSGPGVSDGDTSPMPDLAEKWEQPDEVTYVFNLRKGAKFHDIPPVNGREVDATDVKYSFDRLRDPKTGSQMLGQYAPIKTVDAVDKYTAKFVTAEPYAAFWIYVAHYYEPYIVPREAVEKFGDLKKNAIGTGPFTLEAFEPGVKISMKKNPQYFIQDRPYLDSIAILNVPDESTAKAAYLSGQIDVGSTKYTEIEEIQKALPDSVLHKTYNGAYYAFLMNNQRPPFQELKVRQAIKYAIDQQRLLDTVYQGQGAWGGLVPPLFSDWVLSQDELKRLYKRDVAKAKQLMKEAGYADGFKSTVYTATNYGQVMKDMGLLIMQDLKEIGIQLEFEFREYSKHLKDWLTGNYDTYVGPARVPGDMDEFTYQGFHPKGSRNYTKYEDPKLIAMVEKETAQTNTAERKKTILEIQRYVAEVVPEVPIPLGYAFAVVRGYVKNYAPHFGETGYAGTSVINVWLDK